MNGNKRKCEVMNYKEAKSEYKATSNVKYKLRKLIFSLMYNTSLIFCTNDFTLLPQRILQVSSSLVSFIDFTICESDFETFS